VLSVDNGVATSRRDQLATEEPMEIRVQGPGQDPIAFAVAMRTPGNDFELAVGLLLTEGLIAGADCEYLTADDWGEVTTARAFADVDTPDDWERLGLS